MVNISYYRMARIPREKGTPGEPGTPIGKTYLNQALVVTVLGGHSHRILDRAQF
jgi:hypothetical protein